MNLIGATNPLAFPGHIHLESYSFGLPNAGAPGHGPHDRLAPNPRAMPPGREPVMIGGHELATSLSDLVALNPQPLPPIIPGGQRDLQDGDALSVGRTAVQRQEGRVMLDDDRCETPPGTFPPPPPLPFASHLLPAVDRPAEFGPAGVADKR